MHSKLRPSRKHFSTKSHILNHKVAIRSKHPIIRVGEREIVETTGGAGKLAVLTDVKKGFGGRTNARSRVQKHEHQACALSSVL